MDGTISLIKLMMNSRTAIFILIVACTASCRQPAIKRQQHYSEALFINATEQLKGHDIAPVFAFVDSVYNTFPYISVTDQLRLYRFKRSAYNNALAPRLLAAYSDSTLMLLDSYHLKDEFYTDYAAALMGKAKGYYQIDKAAEAYSFLLEAKNMVTAKGDSCKLADIYEVLANIDYVQARYTVAAENYKQKYQLLQYCHSDFSVEFNIIQGVLNNIGSSYIKAGNADSAMVYLDKGIAYVIKNGPATNSTDHLPERALGVLYGNKAQVFEARGMYAQAAEYFKKDLEINSRPGYEAGDAALVTLQLASLYMKTGNTAAAYTLLNKLQPGLLMLEERSRVEWQRLMWTYYERTGNIAKGYEALKNYFVQKDSLNSKLRLSSGTNAASEISRLETQKELDLFKKDKEFNKLMLNALIFSIILIFCIAILILYNWVRSRQTIVKLSALNRKISERELQLEQLLDSLELREKHKRQQELLLLEQEMEQRQAEAIIEQRKRIADDLHDDINSSIAALKYFITDLKNNSTDPKVKSDLGTVESEVSAIYNNTRNYLHRLNDKSFHLKYDLVRMLEELQKRFEAFSALKIAVQFDKSAVEKYLTQEQQNELYHITREMLANILKHSGATLVEIRLDVTPTICVLVVTDNGNGFVPQKMKAGLGLNSISNRVDFLQGQMEISSIAAGTRFEVSFSI